jgi:hypothetical protein
MFRITKDPPPGSLIQYLAKITIMVLSMSVDMDVVGVTAAYSARGACVCSSLYRKALSYTVLNRKHVPEYIKYVPCVKERTRLQQHPIQ